MLQIIQIFSYQIMDNTNKGKMEEKTLDSVYESLIKFAQTTAEKATTSQNQSSKQIEETIKKLQKQFQFILNQTPPIQSEKAKQKQEWQLRSGTLLKIIDLLIQQILRSNNHIWLEWLASIVKINCVKNVKQQSIYELAKTVNENAVIALPYDEPQATKTLVSPDVASQQQSSNETAYFKEDELLLPRYFESPFHFVQRQGISQFATKLVENINHELIRPFLQKSLETQSLQSFIKFIDFIDSISAPFYTYYLLSLFNQIISKLCEFFTQSKINSNVNSEKMNKITYSLSSISSRWEGSHYYNRVWEWSIKSKAILALLSSNISQTKLTAVKMLCEVVRKIQYSAFQPADLEKYIEQNKILNQIYSPDNHPEIISKGKQVYQFLSKYNILNESQIDILLNIIDKSHENVCKSIYLTIQNLGQKNLEVYYHKIIEKIKQLPRASFFTDEIIQLFQTLIVIAPILDIKFNMNSIYTVIHKHYLKLRKHLREKLVRLYFELFIMGVEEKLFEKEDRTIVVRPIAENLGTNLSALMLDTFIKVVKTQAGKEIYPECRQIVNECLAILFTKFKIHEQLKEIGKKEKNNKLTVTKKNYKEVLANNPNYYSQQIHLALTKYLLECYDGPEFPLNYEQLCQLIEKDISFTKFIQYYNKDQQLKAVETMLMQSHKDIEHISNIIQVYALLNHEVKVMAFQKIRFQFFTSQNFQEKMKLGEFLTANSENFSIDKICQGIKQQSSHEPIEEMRLLSSLILLKFCVEKCDKIGFGKYLPFYYSSNSEDILIKVTNSIDILKPTSYRLNAKSFETLSEIIDKILKHYKIDIESVNFKINDKYMSINDLSLKASEVVKKSSDAQQSQGQQGQKCISITIFEMYQSEWFDKSQLINEGILNDQIIIALSEIFTQYTVSGKMYRQDCARVFEIATQTEKISVNDSRIEHLFSRFSENGEYLTLEEWLNFYQKSSEDNPGVVVNNLKKLGYSHLFRDQKHILQEYGQNLSNVARAYVVENGQEVYEILFRNYQSEQLNRFCKDLLQLLPTQNQYLILKQNDMQEQKKQGSHQFTINIGRVAEKLIELDIERPTQMWYILTLYNKMKQQIMNIDNKVHYLEKISKFIHSQVKFLQLQLNKILISMEINATFLQILSQSASIVKQYFQSQTQSQIIPKTLLTKNKNAQISTNCDDDLNDPLTQLKINDKIKEFSFISHTEVEKLTFMLFSQDKQRWDGTKLNIIKLIDELLLICLHNPQLKRQGRVEIKNQLIFHPKNEIRTIYNNFYYMICEICPQVKFQYYAVNLDEEKNQHEYSHSCVQFFNTLNKMLQLETIENQAQVYWKVSKNIEKSIIQLLEENQQAENKSCSVVLYQAKNTSNSEDILQGQLMILDSMKVYQPDLEISNAENWLTSLLSESHSNSTRAILYRISNKLCSVDFNLKLLSKLMEGVTIHRNSKLRDQSHMGLFNLGCICYINSTIQQLFMIEPFRNAIIATYLPDADQTYFYHFQHLMYQLAFGKREFFIPDQFCLTYTDYENKPIDIKQQHDAEEFLNNLFDRLEKSLKSIEEVNPASSQFIRNNFYGQLASVITCQSCFNQKIRSQDFYVLSLEIKNNKTIDECFSKMTEPEVITDYYCQFCDRKVETIEKQMRIKKLPKFLFIHLQRLVFDLESLSKIKLDHLVEYPENLDLSQYFVGQDPFSNDEERAKFNLKGFIVHTGTSESGHYYSLIKQKGQWIKFDDSRVDEWKWDTSSRQKQNTYLLIYERIENKESEMTQIVKEMHIGSIQLYQKVKQDNELLVKQTIFLQNSFGRHLLQTLSKIEIPFQLLDSSPNQLQAPFHPDYQILSQKQKTQFAEAHDIILSYLRLVSQAKSVGVNFYEVNSMEIKNVTCYLILLLHICPQLTQRSINQLWKSNQNGKINTNYLRMMLIQNDKTLRQAYKLIFTKIISIINVYPESTFHSYLIPSLPNSHLYFIQKILQYMMGSLYDAAKNYNKMEQHFEFLFLLMQISEKACLWFEEQGLGYKLIHFLCGDETPLKSQLLNYNYQNSRKTQAINTISKIICKMIQIYINKSKDGLDQSSLSYRAYCQAEWYSKIYQERYEFNCVGKALALLSQNNQKLSSKLCQLVTEKLNRVSHYDEYILAYINLYQNILSTCDDLTEIRCQMVLGVPVLFVSEEDIIDNFSSRYYKYWSNTFSNSDEFILPLLQLLYTNRLQLNYFTMGTIASTLRLIVKFSHIYKYVSQLPAPPPYDFYTDWMNILLKLGLKDAAICNSSQKRGDLNEIANLINIIQTRRGDQFAKKLQNTQQMQDQSQILEPSQQQEIRQQLLPSEIKFKNKFNVWYRFEGEIKRDQKAQVLVENSYEAQINILADDKQRRVIKYNLNLKENVKSAILTFKQNNYHYQFFIYCNFVELITPWPEDNQNQFTRDRITELFDIKILKEVQPEVMQKNQIKQEISDIKMQEEKKEGYENNNSQQNFSGQQFQCPFCTSISYSFSRKCPTCGQDWGEMM